MAKSPKTGIRRTARTAKGKSNPIDVHVGTRVRLRRTLLGLSQEKLGKAVGLTFQQIQKYERGVNRIGASRLFALAQILDVPIGFFFEGVPANFSGRNHVAKGNHEAAANYDADPMSNRETMELIRAYYRIADPRKRRKVLELLRSFGSDS